jgi:hypothetical protein
MLQHLVDRRSDQLSAAQLLNLKIQLVESATSSSPVFLSTVKRAPGFQDGIRVGLSLVLDPHFVCSTPTSSSLYPPIPCNSLPGQTPSVSEHERRSPDNGETTFRRKNDMFLLLTEHNLLCETFGIITSSLTETAQCATIIPRLLDALNRIWSLPEWKYFPSTSGGVSLLFSDGQFLEMAYHVVKFCEEQLKRRRAQESGGACDLFYVAPLQQMLPLLLWLLQCIHALWQRDHDDFLPEELEEAKCLSCVDLAATLRTTNGLYDIDSLHKNKTGALLEGTRQRAYNALGLCTSVDGAFSELLDSRYLGDALTRT